MVLPCINLLTTKETSWYKTLVKGMTDRTIRYRKLVGLTYISSENAPCIAENGFTGKIAFRVCSAFFSKKNKRDLN